MSLSENALVTVCLCTKLGRGEQAPALDVGEWTDLVRLLTGDRNAAPRDLLGKDATELERQFGIEPALATRIESLLRELRDSHPHRIRVETDHARRLAGVLMNLDHVAEVKILGETALEFVTLHPDTAYAELPGLVVEADAPIRFLETLDNTLEAVFEHVTATGTARL